MHRPAALLAAALLAGPSSAGPLDGRIYPAPRAPLSLQGLPAEARLVEVTTTDGLMLKGLAVPARAAMPTLLVFHGNGSSAATTIDWLRPLIAAGYGVVAAEYRGYSANPGHPDEAGLARDADAFLALARAQAAVAPVWLVGHSLGGAVALNLARRARPAAIITIGAFTRLRDAAPSIARGLLSDAYRNIDAIPALDVPFFLIHGTADDTVPIAQGAALHDAAGATHNSGASFVLMESGHRPDAVLLVPIFATIGHAVAGNALTADGLPASVKLVPFGQRRPLNP